MKYKKYDNVTKLAISIKGLSTTSCPIHPKLKESEKKYQKNQMFKGLKKLLRNTEVSTKGNNANTKIDNPIKTTPPNLSGMVRNTA
jgi:hypothetical protein